MANEQKKLCVTFKSANGLPNKTSQDKFSGYDQQNLNFIGMLGLEKTMPAALINR